MAVALGSLVDEQTRCVHWNGPTDVIAIRFRCCGGYYACFDCHAELATHPPQRWGPDQLDAVAVLCGVCGAELTIAAYLGCGFVCPSCGASFNPGCASHYHLYFELPDG
ncbi:MAG: CHY zinc finger protein [Candidatus Binatia bacterium]